MPETAQVDFIPLKIAESNADAKLAIKRWIGPARTRRALKICGKIFGSILILCCFTVFVHPLILPTISLVTISIIGSPLLFFYLRGQDATFDHAEGKCPHCAHEGRLNSYLWITLKREITLICPKCGQTLRATAEGL